jgi:hypothetical protein
LLYAPYFEQIKVISKNILEASCNTFTPWFESQI